MAEPILDFDTLLERPTVVIDSVAYPLRATDAFSILEYKAHVKEASRFSDLLNQEAPLTDAEEAEREQLSDAYCRRVLPAPDAVHQRLSGWKRLQIIVAFAQLPASRGWTSGATAATPQPTTTATGASSSPAVPGSSAATH